MPRADRSSAAAVVTLPTDREIVIVRRFAAPRTDVFAAWTTAARITDWWDPRHIPLAVCEVDLRPGGAFRFVPGGGGAPAFSGHYREIVPPSRLVFTTAGPSAGSTTVGTLVFEEADGVTTLTITMEADSPADRDALLSHRVDAGTVQTLENLAVHLTASSRPEQPARSPHR